MTSPFLKHLKQQNDQYGPPTPASSSPLPGLLTSTRPATTTSPPLPTPTSPRGLKPAGARPLPQPPPKPANLQQRSPSAGWPRPSSPKRGGFSQPPASYAAAQQQVAPDWAREHASAEQTFPELAKEVKRPVRRYEEASSSYVGGMAKLNLDSSPSTGHATSVDAPPSQAPAIAIEAPSISVSDSTPPSFNFTADDGPALDYVPRIVARSAAKKSAPSSNPNSLICAECDTLITGKIVNAMKRRFHPGCFKCVQCSILLEHVAFHERDGSAYCQLCYHDLFTVRCDHCKTPIVDESYVTIEDAGLGGRKNYHELHFYCSECGTPFIDPKSLARKSAISKDPALREAPDAPRPPVEAKPFVIHQGYAYCEACDVNMRAPKCARCRKPIAGDILKALGKPWHDTCFVCTDCGKPFETSSFFTRADAPCCERCYTDHLRREM